MLGDVGVQLPQVLALGLHHHCPVELNARWRDTGQWQRGWEGGRVAAQCVEGPERHLQLLGNKQNDLKMPSVTRSTLARARVWCAGVQGRVLSCQRLNPQPHMPDGKANEPKPATASAAPSFTRAALTLGLPCGKRKPTSGRAAVCSTEGWGWGRRPCYYISIN